ncbi:MAG: PAS domain-containing sensor histidine kinase, partial [Pseudomonadales bacterium]
VTTLYLAVVLLVMVLLARARISRQRSQYEQRELQALEVLRREPSYQRSEIITLATGRPVERTQYLVQSALVGNSDLNVSILADLAPVKRQVFNVLLFVTTLYLAVVLLVMVLLARARISRQRSQYEQREIQALERSEAKIKAVLDNTWAGLITLDDQGAIESMNRTAQILLGYKLTQLQGRRFSDVLRGDELEHYRQQLDPHYSGPSDQLLESVAVCSDGREIPVEFVVGTMRQAGALRYLITVQDITERKEYERELEQARQLLESRVEQRTADLTHANERLLREIKQHSKTQDELIQTAKLAVLGQLSAGINHELNQPLMAIRGYADNARQFLQLQKSARAESNLHEIALLTERMAKILHPLKEFSRKSSSEQSRVSVSALRQGVLAILAPRIEQSEAHLAWPAPDEERYVFGDLLRLEQVMVNLLSNALDAIEQRAGGNIAVSHHWSGDGQLQLRVRDSGGGIEDALLAKIFEPFYTTKGEGQGLGLGLSISARIVEDIGGKLYAQNIPGGAQFTLQLQTVDGRVAGQEWEIAENE